MKRHFDIKAYLDSRQIYYKTGGENVTKGWIEITCVLPGCSDHKEHLGINLKSLKYNCWLCRQKGHALRLIQIIDDCGEREALRIASQFPSEESESPWYEEEPERNNTTISLPSEIQTEWPETHLSYLRSRGFDPDVIIPKYDLRPVFTIGDYRFRIIIPIYVYGQLVSFTSMDVLRQGDRPPYKDCPVEQAIIPVKESLYNIDRVRDKAVLFEGCTGVWRFGDGSIASFTSYLSQEQIALIARKKLRSVFVLYDPDAEEKGNRMAYQLSGVVRQVDQICFTEGDPKDLPPSEMAQLKRDLGF